jgi:uncharacterized MAPEG superfamily protein
MSIALWCVLIAALLPIATVGFAKIIAGRFDNNDPRGRAASYDGTARRAYAAHQNGFEAFPLFAAAVLLAEMKGGQSGIVDALAIAFVVARIAYAGCYIADLASLRSLVWTAGLCCSIAIFVSPLWR